MQHVPPLFRLLDEHKIAYFWKNARGVYLAVNDSGAKMVGSTVNKVVGQTDFAFFEASSATLMQERDSNILRSGKLSIYDSVTKAAGKWIHFRSCKLPIASPHLAETSLIGISVDVSTNADAERLACLRDATLALEREPREFLNSMLRHLASVSPALPRALGDVLEEMPQVK